jgi:hypothetical protein
MYVECRYRYHETDIIPPISQIWIYFSSDLFKLNGAHLPISSIISKTCRTSRCRLIVTFRCGNCDSTSETGKRIILYLFVSPKCLFIYLFIFHQELLRIFRWLGGSAVAFLLFMWDFFLQVFIHKTAPWENEFFAGVIDAGKIAKPANISATFQNNSKSRKCNNQGLRSEGKDT